MASEPDLLLVREREEKKGKRMKTARMGVAFLVAVMAASGCHKPPAPPPVGTLTSDAVTDQVANRSFFKTWHLQITPEVQMNVTSELTPWLEKCDSSSCGEFALGFSDELKQRDGKWVNFDCDNVAEKIIDRDLVPKVETACSSVHEIAKMYWIKHNDPTEFTDDKGRVWKRQ